MYSASLGVEAIIDKLMRPEIWNEKKNKHRQERELRLGLSKKNSVEKKIDEGEAREVIKAYIIHFEVKEWKNKEGISRIGEELRL